MDQDLWGSPTGFLELSSINEQAGQDSCLQIRVLACLPSADAHFGLLQLHCRFLVQVVDPKKKRRRKIDVTAISMSLVTLVTLASLSFLECLLLLRDFDEEKAKHAWSCKHWHGHAHKPVSVQHHSATSC